jgi:hypothetical protein
MSARDFISFSVDFTAVEDPVYAAVRAYLLATGKYFNMKPQSLLSAQLIEDGH